MWQSPVYRFPGPDGKSISFDVTYSVPRNLNDPGALLKEIFTNIISNLKPSDQEPSNQEPRRTAGDRGARSTGKDGKKQRSRKDASPWVLDIGAGKLRNTQWFLDKGCQVWAAEFPELQHRLQDAKKIWTAARRRRDKLTKRPLFTALTPPRLLAEQLDAFKESFDLILLINSINTMPLPAERITLLYLCRQLVKEQGVLLWHNWRAKSIHPESYTPENEIIDGYRMGPGPHHTFYVEYDREETMELLYALGFTPVDSPAIPPSAAKSNFSYLFRPSHAPLLSKAFDFKQYLRPPRDPKEIIPVPDPLPILDLYIKELQHVPEGPSGAHQYQVLVSRILFEVFREELDEPDIEEDLDERRKRADIVYQNRNRPGVFRNLREVWQISCPVIIAECKNYKQGLANREFDQLSSRLNPDLGMLGFLLCRDKKDPAKVLKQCRDRYYREKKHVVVLDDQDLATLAVKRLQDRRSAGEAESEVTRFITRKIREIRK